MKVRKITSERLIKMAASDSNKGVCLGCGASQDGCEPDARGYKCDNCGVFMVYGAEEAILMGYGT